jgi:hypothetical protein
MSAKSGHSQSLKPSKRPAIVPSYLGQGHYHTVPCISGINSPEVLSRTAAEDPEDTVEDLTGITPGLTVLIRAAALASEA